MSTTLQWQPILTEWEPLDDKLKFALQKRCDGFVESHMNFSAIPYLEGLRDAGIKDAQKLIDAIEKHDEILVRESF